jgi:hypothetical protein
MLRSGWRWARVISLHFLEVEWSRPSCLGRLSSSGNCCPKDLKLEIEHLSQDEASEMEEFLARVAGRGHARQLSASDRTAWLAELQLNRSTSLDAPSWLWNSVVDLVAAHEAAYLTALSSLRTEGRVN